MLDASRGPFEPFWGHVEELTTLETLSPVASKVVPLRKPCPCLGWAPRRCLLNGLMLAHLGAILVHLRSMLGPCSPILGLCWGYVDPRRWFWSYVVFMSSPSFPIFAWKSSPQWPARQPLHFCNTISLKKLNPDKKDDQEIADAVEVGPSTPESPSLPPKPVDKKDDQEIADAAGGIPLTPESPIIALVFWNCFLAAAPISQCLVTLFAMAVY